MEKRKEVRYPVHRPVKLTVLGDHPAELDAYMSNLSGRGLRMTTSEAVPVSAAVKVNFDDTMMLGEVCYCEPSGTQWAVGLEMEQALSDLSGLGNLVERLMIEERGARQAMPAQKQP